MICANHRILKCSGFCGHMVPLNHLLCPGHLGVWFAYVHNTLSEETLDEPIPSEYSNYADIFSATEANKLPDTQVTHNIDLFPGKELPWKPIYPMLAIELDTL